MTKRIRFSSSIVSFALVALALVSCSQRESVANESGIHFVKKEGSNPSVVAKYDGKEISADELEKSSPDVFDSRLKVYQAQKRAVEEFVRNRILDGLAKKANLSTEEFMKKEMEAAKKQVSAKDVDAFLKKNNVADLSKVPEHIRDQVRGLLHVQKLVADATKKNEVEIYLKRPVAPKIDFKTEGQVTWGDKNAAVTIIEFSDFQCPFCARGKERLSELKKLYGKKIQVIYKQFPLPMHPDARPAAEASLCVNDQGSDKFWKFHDIVFESQAKLSAADLKAYAKKAGADEKKFDECVAAKKFAAQVDANIEEGRKAGVDSTPSFFVNSQPIRGARDVAEFREIIDEALAK